MLQNVTALFFLLLTAILLGWTIMRARKGIVPNIRKLPALDAIEEAIALCAEKGTMAWFPMGGGPIDDPQGSPGQLVSMSVLGYATKYCADMGVKLVTGTNRANMVPMLDDVLFEGFRAHDASDLHSLENVRFFPSQMAYIAGNSTIHEYEGPACQIMIGNWWAETPAFCEIAKRKNAFIVGGTDYMENVAYLVAFSDYSLVFEEIYAAGAYIGDDVEAKGTILAEDIMKFVFIGLSILGLLAVLTGNYGIFVNLLTR
jgi:hypothetical protein